MAVAYYGSHISEHLVKTPEGYLICYGVPINRTGEQDYAAGELGLEGDSERAVKVYRLEEDVFAPAALASLEGKDVTRGHPPEMLSAANQAAYSKGHLENVRREGENTVADLVIKDPALASDVESGVLREVSCGYHCQFRPYRDGYRQTNIIGNHVAVVPRGRAGRDVAIKDAAQEAEKGREHMSKFWKSFLTAFGMAARDASPEELDKMVDTTATVLDADPAGEALDADPTEDPPAKEKPAEDAEPAQDTMDARLGRLEAMLAQLMAKKEEPRLSDESDLDELIARLAGKKEDGSITVPAENDSADGLARDAAVLLLKKARPAVAAIKDREDRARVTDALLGAVGGKDAMGELVRAAMDAARAKAKQTGKRTFEQVCADAEAEYAARNPHTVKEEN